MIKALPILLLFISTLSFGDTYKLALYQWEPFTDSNKESGGISTEIIRRALQSQGHSIEIVKMPWSRALVQLDKKEVDILPAVWFTEERTETMNYSQPYTHNRLVFIKSKNSDFEFNGMKSLHGKVVGVIRGYAYDGKIKNEDKIKFSVSDSLESNIKKVINGRIDLTLDDEIATKAIISSQLIDKIDFTKNALNEVPLYITCNKASSKCDEIIRSFNQGLNTLIDNGSIQTLLSGTDL